MLKDCKLVRPKKKSGGMEVKLLLSRLTSWRKVRLAKVGTSPERELRGTLRVLSWESWLMSDGRFPVRDLEGMFMEITRLELSQVIPSHLQKSLLLFQEDGAGEREAENFAMTAASSAAAKERKRKKVRQRRRR